MVSTRRTYKSISGRRSLLPCLRLLALAPVPAVLIVTGFRGYIVGDRAWLNVMLDRWNTVHEGGLALFSGTASERDIWAFALLAAK